MLVLAAGCAPLAVDGATTEKARSFAAEVDGQRVFDDVVTLSTQHQTDTRLDCASLNSRLDTWCNLSATRARSLVQARLASLGMRVDLEVSDTHPPTTNVIAELPGTSKPDEVVMVAAHFDAFYSGADDNSSGVAVMLEVARLLAVRPLARTVRFAGFDLEELGLVGSTRHVAVRKAPKASLVLDTVGYSDTKPGSQASLPGLPTPAAGDFLAVIANDVSRGQVEQLTAVSKDQQVPPLVAIVAPGRGAGPLSGNLMRSDHAPLWLAGESAVFFTDTANFRNPNYHLPSDTPETLDKTFLTGVARASVLAITAWGDAP
jgi:Zn-dependent M28 family amino/carboxypeptidase